MYTIQPHRDIIWHLNTGEIYYIFHIFRVAPQHSARFVLFFDLQAAFTPCVTQEYFKNNFRLTINFKNIEVQQKKRYLYKKCVCNGATDVMF